jgi:hypothetical protein
MIVFAFCGKLRRSHGEEKIARTKAKFATPPLSDRLRRPRTQHEHDALGKMGTSCFRSRARSRSGSMAVRRSGSGRFTPDGLGHPSAPPPSRSETRQSRSCGRGLDSAPRCPPAPGQEPGVRAAADRHEPAPASGCRVARARDRRTSADEVSMQLPSPAPWIGWRMRAANWRAAVPGDHPDGGCARTGQIPQPDLWFQKGTVADGG